MEFEETFFCRFFDAFLAQETLCIPCDFQETNEDSVFAPKNGASIFPKSVNTIAQFNEGFHQHNV
jgi:hypothetical protein